MFCTQVHKTIVYTDVGSQLLGACRHALEGRAASVSLCDCQLNHLQPEPTQACLAKHAWLPAHIARNHPTRCDGPVTAEAAPAACSR